MINLKKTAKIYKIIKKVKEQIKYLLLTIHNLSIYISLFSIFSLKVQPLGLQNYT